MPNYQLRLTREFSTENPDVIIGLSALAGHGACQHWIVYQHEADEQVNRTHLHVYYFDWALGEQSFRNRFKEVFPDVEAKDFAISTTAGRGKGAITINGAVKYSSKDGTIKNKVVRGFDAEAIQKIESSFVKEVIPAKPVEPRQMTKWRLVEICKAEIEQWEKNNHSKITKTLMVELVIEMLNEYKQVFSHHKIIEICETIATLRNDADAMKENIIKSLRF